MLKKFVVVILEKKYLATDVEVEKKNLLLGEAARDIMGVGDWLVMIGLLISLGVVVYNLATGDNPERAKKLLIWWVVAIVVYTVIKGVAVW